VELADDRDQQQEAGRYIPSDAVMLDPAVASSLKATGMPSLAFAGLVVTAWVLNGWRQDFTNGR
jgi:hypothetical protein